MITTHLKISDSKYLRNATFVRMYDEKHSQFENDEKNDTKLDEKKKVGFEPLKLDHQSAAVVPTLPYQTLRDTDQPL